MSTRMKLLSAGAVLSMVFALAGVASAANADEATPADTTTLVVQPTDAPAADSTSAATDSSSASDTTSSSDTSSPPVDSATSADTQSAAPADEPVTSPSQPVTEETTPAPAPVQAVVQTAVALGEPAPAAVQAQDSSSSNHHQIPEGDIFLPTIGEVVGGYCPVAIPEGNANSVHEYYYVSALVNGSTVYEPGDTFQVPLGDTVSVHMVGVNKGISGLLWYFGATDPGPDVYFSEYLPVPTFTCETAVDSVAVNPPEPSFNSMTGTLTVPTVSQTGGLNGYVDNTNSGAALTPGQVIQLSPGDTRELQAVVSGVPENGVLYYIPEGQGGPWSYTYATYTPAEPTHVGNVITTPSSDQFTYSNTAGVSGDTISLSKDLRSVTVKATVKEGVPLTPGATTSWTYVYVPVAFTPDGPTKAGDNTYTIPATECGTYVNAAGDTVMGSIVISKNDTIEFVPNGSCDVVEGNWQWPISYVEPTPPSNGGDNGTTVPPVTVVQPTSPQPAVDVTTSGVKAAADESSSDGLAHTGSDVNSGLVLVGLIALLAGFGLAAAPLWRRRRVNS